MSQRPSAPPSMMQPILLALGLILSPATLDARPAQDQRAGLEARLETLADLPVDEILIEAAGLSPDTEESDAALGADLDRAWTRASTKSCASCSRRG
jgi:hypothetical protein